ncbi:MAG: flagellar basal body rod protein FlgC [Phycisphaerae bacterium]|nr:flagellar basal body rod protein FlgC [Phycisphaerae bacterium]
MFSAIDISTSGLAAQRVRMNTVAMNMANIDSDNPDGTGPYKRRSVIFEVGMGPNNQKDGVHVSKIEQEDNFRMEYDPNHHRADENGYVKMPAIDQMTEMVNMMEAERAYQANMTAMEVTKGMITSSLRLLA